MQRQEFSSAQRRLNRTWLLDLSRLHQNIVAFMSGRPQERSLPLGMIHRAVLKEIKRAAECYSLETSFNSLRNSGQEVAVTLRKTEISALPKARTRIYRRIEQECVDSDRDKQAALDMGFVDDGMSVVIRRPYGKQAGGVWSDEQGGGNNKKNKKNNNGRRRHQTGPSSGDDDGGDAGRQGSRRSGKKNKQKNTKRPTGNSGDAKSSSSTAGGGNRHGSVVGASAAPIDESNVGHRLLQKMGKCHFIVTRLLLLSLLTNNRLGSRRSIG
jgi:hypothetical protein